MAELKDLIPQLDKLESQLEDLEEVLEPLLGDLNEVTSQLPLLDKAKLFSLNAYAIHSLLFAALRVQGADTQDHPVYAELKRVQQYFAKIKAAEEPEAQRKLVVNKEAAARVLRAGLGDDETVSRKLAEKIAEEKAKALLKSVENQPSQGKKRRAEESASASPKTGGKDGNKKKKKTSKR